MRVFPRSDKGPRFFYARVQMNRETVFAQNRLKKVFKYFPGGYNLT